MLTLVNSGMKLDDLTINDQPESCTTYGCGNCGIRRPIPSSTNFATIEEDSKNGIF